MADLSKNQEEALEKIRRARGGLVELPVATGTSLVNRELAVHVSPEEDEMAMSINLAPGHALYRAP